MLHVHRSNRVEALIERLAALVSDAPADPFAKETIVVQGKGMERWISMELAARLGVWANPSFPFPRTLLNDVADRVLGKRQSEVGRAFEPEALVWAVAARLRADRAEPALGPLVRYLEKDERHIRRMSLASEIASTFDRYVLYRPDRLAAWERGGFEPGEDWQPLLWRELVGGADPSHLAARLRKLVKALERGRIAGAMPPRISIFGISTLAPLYLDAFAALARATDVHLFVLAPSREFMASALTRRDEARLAKGQLSLGFGPGPDRGHLLVEALGKLGREFQDSLAAYEAIEADLFVEPSADTMLGLLQSDILHFVDRGPDGPEAPLPFTNDGTVAIHACHSRMREVEVLHDQLLAMLDADPTLEPRNVVVMAPSIEEYAPYVDAVFSADVAREKIPYAIADRGPRAAEPVVDAFFRILEILGGRLGAPEVFDLLSLEVVRARFGIEGGDLEDLRRWIADARVRWGIDERHREAEGQPPLRGNTWRFGLDRLLLGFAMGTDDDRVFHGVLPVDGIEGTDGALVGRLADFCETLFSFRAFAEEPASPADWAARLGTLLSALVATLPEVSDQHRRIRTALGTVTERARDAGFVEPVHLEAYVRELAREIGEGGRAVGFLSGGVTFCAMVPMRSIPFRVVWLLGMNDGEFPRSVRPPGFDLTARAPRKGDRSRRDDDRYLFLEALLSARERFALSYVGRSIRDDSVVPPSVVVSDLLDALARSFTIGDASVGREDVARELVVVHPLQAFSERYFAGGDPRLFSYSRGALEGAAAERGYGAEPRFVDGPLVSRRSAARAEREEVVALGELEFFLEKSSEWFCRRVLNLRLRDRGESLDDAEPLELDALDRWEIGHHILGRLVDGAPEESVFPALVASGLLPPGTLGRVLYEELLPQAERIARACEPFRRGHRVDPLPVDLEIGGVRLVGVLRDLWSDAGQVDWRFSKLGGRHELRLWLRHLVLNLVPDPGVPRTTAFAGRPEKDDDVVLARFGGVDHADRVLGSLIALYGDAMHEPVPFFAETSRTFAEALREADDTNEERALREAEKKFLPGAMQFGDGRDRYVTKLFGEEYDLGSDPRFRRFAVEVFRPLLEARPGTRE